MTRRPPARAEPETATERVELKLTPSQMATWRAVMESRGIPTVKQLAVEAVDAYGARDDEGELADLGRDVIALVKARRRGR